MTQFTRRSFLKHSADAAVLSSFVRDHPWLLADEVDERWNGMSKLDGALLLDEAHREQMATDFGAQVRSDGYSHARDRDVRGTAASDAVSKSRSERRIAMRSGRQTFPYADYGRIARDPLRILAAG